MKPKYPRKEITYRPMKNFNLASFQSDLSKAMDAFDTTTGSVSLVVDNYNAILEETLEKHAPLKKRTVTVHPQPPWYNDTIHEAKKERRKAEKKWHKTGLTVHKEIYKEKKMEVIHLIKNSKKDFYKDRLSQKSGDQK
jgi:hypothetical protein